MRRGLCLFVRKRLSMYWASSLHFLHPPMDIAETRKKKKKACISPPLFLDTHADHTATHADRQLLI